MNLILITLLFKLHQYYSSCSFLGETINQSQLILFWGGWQHRPRLHPGGLSEVHRKNEVFDQLHLPMVMKLINTSCPCFGPFVFCLMRWFKHSGDSLWGSVSNGSSKIEAHSSGTSTNSPTATWASKWLCIWAAICIISIACGWVSQCFFLISLRTIAFSGRSVLRWRSSNTSSVECGVSWERIWRILASIYKNETLVIQSDLFGMVKWPFKGLSNLQLGNQKVTLNHLDLITAFCSLILIRCKSLIQPESCSQECVQFMWTDGFTFR